MKPPPAGKGPRRPIRGPPPGRVSVRRLWRRVSSATSSEPRWCLQVEPMPNPRTLMTATGIPLSRRQALKTAGAGFGYLALAGMLAEAAERRRSSTGALSPRPPHFPVRAKRIIFVFMEGALSQMDTFEYKARLQRDDGK